MCPSVCVCVILQVEHVVSQVVSQHEKRDYVVPVDPGWSKQWSLVCQVVEYFLLALSLSVVHTTYVHYATFLRYWLTVGKDF